MTVQSVINYTDGLLGDKLVMRSPIPMTVILITYLLIILKIGPSYMKSRPAYQLKTYIIVYNLLQVIACVYLTYKMLVVDVPVLHFWKCIDLIPGTKPALDFVHICHFTFWLKVTELSETVVFVLRKKQRQVSFLHVFHHCATLSLVFQFFRSYKTSAAMFPLLLNCNVHIVMYVYYLLAAVLPANVVSKLTPLKKSITTIQIVQFIVILIQVFIGYARGCNIPTWFLAVYVLIISSFFYMFYNFYKKNYTAKRQNDAAAEARRKRESN